MQKDIIGVYADEKQVVTAINQLGEQGVKVKDVYTPFPVFEIIEAMGLKTRFPYFAFAFGVAGFGLTFLFLYWTSVVSYPLVIGGKPYLSLTFVVILFVMTILVTVISSLTAFFVRDKKGPGQVAQMYHPDINDDKFVLVVTKTSKMSDEDASKITAIIQNTGAIEVNEKEIEEAPAHVVYGAHQPQKEALDIGTLREKIVSAAIKIYNELGNMFPKQVYLEALAYELKNEDLLVEKDVPKSIKYENIQINEAYMIDILVNKNILLAIYVDEEVKNEHVEQALNYMRLAGYNNGLLINFKQKSIDEGIRHLEL